MRVSWQLPESRVRKNDDDDDYDDAMVACKGRNEKGGWREKRLPRVFQINSNNNDEL